MADDQSKASYPPAGATPRAQERTEPVPEKRATAQEPNLAVNTGTDQAPAESGTVLGWLGKRMVRVVAPNFSGQLRDANNFREMVETVVFVVVLVLLLKTFAAEAFVIPTGSMATTLWGYQKYVTCPKCGHRFPVNCSEEVEKRDGQPFSRVTGCTCPNCRYPIDFSKEHIDPDSNSGDRVLVAKYLYDSGVRKPQRLDVVVFKYPEKPQPNYTPMNYIKRLIGLPGETIGIYFGKLYVVEPDKGLKYDESERRGGPLDWWEHGNMHEDEARDLLEQGDPRFDIIRKSPDKILALRRLVYDNDCQASDLTKYPRWAGVDDGTTWVPEPGPDHSNGFRHESREGGQADWLRYRHILRQPPGAQDDKPELITDFMGYNSKLSGEMDHQVAPVFPQDWVGDLILECDVTLDQPDGELVLELAKGVDRFQARWEFAGPSAGKWTLVRIPTAEKPGSEQVLATSQTALKKKTYRLRFADVDQRLTLWVDNGLPFGKGGSDYAAPARQGPTRNDLQPASIGVRGGGVKVHQLKLWRDTYYTQEPGRPDSSAMKNIIDARLRRDLDLPDGDLRVTERDKQEALHKLMSDPDKFSDLGELHAKTLFVQAEPHHYLCLGDNSMESSDSRVWGLVPERLLLGRALVVYYPFHFEAMPFFSPVNRMGAIR